MGSGLSIGVKKDLSKISTEHELIRYYRSIKKYPDSLSAEDKKTLDTGGNNDVDIDELMVAVNAQRNSLFFPTFSRSDMETDKRAYEYLQADMKSHPGAYEFRTEDEIAFTFTAIRQCINAGFSKENTEAFYASPAAAGTWTGTTISLKPPCKKFSTSSTDASRPASAKKRCPLS